MELEQQGVWGPEQVKKQENWATQAGSAYFIQYSYKFVGFFPCAQVDLRKARERERELATLDEK